VTAMPTADVRPHGGPTLARTYLDDHRDLAAVASSYLDASERSELAGKSQRAQAPWLLGRIAAKHAVRDHLAEYGWRAIEPRRIVVSNDLGGRPCVHVPGLRLSTAQLAISISHKATAAVALAGLLPARADSGLGVDLETVETRSGTFERMVLSDGERHLEPPEGDDRDTWLTRIWAVKEAVAKSTGRGLGGRPKDYVIETAAAAGFVCRGILVRTEILATSAGRYVIAWTDIEPKEQPW
jgi:phosphopantetheinyl transferase (holo-ACP synthase)